MTLQSNIPRLVTAALRGGAGKTLVTVGLIAALRRRGLSIAAFKKGPDYIDAGWLGLAAQSQCHNLDSYLFPEQVLRSSFQVRSSGRKISVVEGNRGLYDGVDASGSYSTAALAKMLEAPTLLVLDCTKMTRTSAALVLGCHVLDPDLDLRGVVLNRVAGARHESVVRQAIESATSLPVVGSVHKLALRTFPQRHLGLLPFQEHPGALEFVAHTAQVMEQSVDVDRVVSIALEAPEIRWCCDRAVRKTPGAGPIARVGIIRDSAFQFYYPENLEALEANGAELVRISALDDAALPDVDALYIGGGFPETHAERLANNGPFLRSLNDAVKEGLPVYAECGGLMFLARNLCMDDKIYPMAGVFPVNTIMRRKPQGLGYIRVEVSEKNPFFREGMVLTGHEFHYSSIVPVDNSPVRFAFRVLRGHGIDGHVDGICTNNALGTYVHVHALGAPEWAGSLVRRAADFRNARTGPSHAGQQQHVGDGIGVESR